jgi:hypothetical protein
MLDYDGMPDDFFTTYRSKIGNVRAEDIRDNAVRYLSQARAIILIIGSDQVYQEISANFGKVTRIGAKF